MGEIDDSVSTDRRPGWAPGVPIPPELGPGRTDESGTDARPFDLQHVFDWLIDRFEPAAGSRRGAVVSLAIIAVGLFALIVIAPIVLVTHGNGADTSSPQYQTGYHLGQKMAHDGLPRHMCSPLFRTLEPGPRVVEMHPQLEGCYAGWDAAH